MGDAEKDSAKSTVNLLLNPVVLIAISILISVFFLIGAAILGLDRGVLGDMSRTEFARGLITYLFAVVTIGTAVVLVVSALTSGSDEHHKEQFQRGKEILSLLLGVFGTIVGFYFGSAVAQKTPTEEQVLQVATLHLSTHEATSKSPFTVTTLVSGGQRPLKYSVVLGNAAADFRADVGPDGWIAKDVIAPEVTSDQEADVKVEVRDADGHTAERSTKLTVKPAR